MTKEERKVYGARYYQKNKEKIYERDSKFRKENRERVNAQSRAHGSTPKGSYSRHKSHAKERGVPFLLTFEEWWSVWEEHFHLRGCTKKGLVMCRKGDEGAYEVGNVYIDTQSANMKLRWELWRAA